MILYKKLDYLAQRIRYEATYQEMKYYLKQILNGKNTGSKLRIVGNWNRDIGKSCALARLAVKYDIPVAVPFKSWESLYTREIPERIPKYFKCGIPRVIVVNDSLHMKSEDIVLMEECIDYEKYEAILSHRCKHIVGYQSI